MQCGPDQLRDWMARRFPNSDRKARETAELFGWDESFISKLLNRKRAPGLQNAITIQAHTGIPVEAWVSSALDDSDSETPTIVGKRR